MQIIGTWHNTAAPYKHTMHIAYSQPFYAVSLDLQTQSCGGAVDGLATYDQAEQTLLLQTPAADEEVCTIRIHIAGGHATITESSACLYHHGVACNFAGRLEKMAETAVHLAAFGVLPDYHRAGFGLEMARSGHQQLHGFAAGLGLDFRRLECPDRLPLA